MIIISYDFACDKTRSRFSKFLKKFGNKIQYSVYQIKNSPRILNLILAEIEHRYKPLFKNTDSVLIFQICEKCQKKIIRYGSASHEEKDVIYFE